MPLITLVCFKIFVMYEKSNIYKVDCHTDPRIHFEFFKVFQHKSKDVCNQIYVFNIIYSKYFNINPNLYINQKHMHKLNT